MASLFLSCNNRLLGLPDAFKNTWDILLSLHVKQVMQGGQEQLVREEMIVSDYSTASRIPELGKL